VIERIAAAAALGEDGASGEVKALDAQDDVVGHQAHDGLPEDFAPPVRDGVGARAV
jgi:hypothetical protein